MLDFLISKIEICVRLIMVTRFSEILPLYIVTEFPKSGGSWVSQMISEYMGVPFPRNKFPRFESSVMHGHYLYHPNMKNVFVVVRDGRDAMVSLYYHSLFKNDLFNERVVQKTLKDLKFDDYDDIKGNLPEFIRYRFKHRKKKYGLLRRFTWSEFVNHWIDRDVAFVKYENLLKDTVEELGQAVKKVSGVEPDKDRLGKIAKQYSFENVAKRKAGIENRHSFLRKGIAGDWRNNFTRESRVLFNQYAGDELIKLGYEIDESWVEREDL